MSLSENLEAVEQKVAMACERSGRERSEVRVMAVTKKQPAAMVREAADLGMTLFGENRIQEARTKIPECPPHLEWHFIGHLQTNKAREAVQYFHTVQGVDSLKLALELEKAAEKMSRQVRVLLEVNAAGEASKFGFSPADLLGNIDELCHLKRVEVHGFMGMAPLSVNPERVRPVFRQLKQLQSECEDRVGVPFPVLSMGMSGDYEVAIEEGATIVRLGTTLFGDRA